MADHSFPIFAIIASLSIGYLLGAVPIAAIISRWHGVNIFAVGTGLPGASNVLRSVGKVPAFLVLIGDMGKGAGAIMAGDALGVSGPWLVVPASAAVLGHWRSVFTGFKGGDGLATLGGAIVAMFPAFGMISVAVAMLVALGGQLMPYSSLMSIVAGYATLLGLNIAYDGETTLAVGVGGLASLVLAHAIVGHRRRRTAGWEDLEMDDGARAAGHTGTQ